MGDKPIGKACRKAGYCVFTLGADACTLCGAPRSAWGREQPPFARPKRKRRTDRQGRAWEMRLEQWHRQYREAGDADVTKNNVPTKVVKGRLIRSGKADVDYDGTLPGGRSVRFDAKEVTEGGYLDISLAHFPRHQREALARHHALGAVCFLAVWFREQGAEGYRLYPWATVDTVLKDGINELWQGDGVQFPDDAGWYNMAIFGWNL